MADQDPSGFNVVDRRRATAEASSEPQADAAPEATATSHSPDSSPDAQPGSSSETTPPPGTDGAAAPDQSDTDENAFGPDPITLLAIAGMQADTLTLAQTLVAVFDGHAWRAMGLMASPHTGETQVDLPAAQLAIDCVQFLLGKVEGSLSDSERHEAQRRLTDLRMNYLAKLRETGS